MRRGSGLRILLTGKSGLLGTELQKIMKFDYTPSHKELDITDFVNVYTYLEDKQVNLIVHCAAYTAVESAEDNKQECYDVNVIGTKNLMKFNIPMIYISTEYVFGGTCGLYKEKSLPSPINFYAMTKLYGEMCVSDGLIIRCLFKERPWKYSKAFTDQWTSGDYVDVIAKEIKLAIENRGMLPEIIHIGTGRKSIYDLASQTRDVEKVSRYISKTTLPKDCSLDTTKWEERKEFFRRKYDTSITTNG